MGAHLETIQGPQAPECQATLHMPRRFREGQTGPHGALTPVFLEKPLPSGALGALCASYICFDHSEGVHSQNPDSADRERGRGRENSGARIPPSGFRHCQSPRPLLALLSASHCFTGNSRSTKMCESDRHRPVVVSSRWSEEGASVPRPSLQSAKMRFFSCLYWSPPAILWM